MSETDNSKNDIQQMRRKKALSILGAIFICLGLLFGIYWLAWSRYQEYTDDAYVAGNLVQLMPQVTGTVISINTDDTHLVLEGQPLVLLDNTDARIALEHAKATLADTVRQVRQYYDNVKQAEANLKLRRADLEKSQSDLMRRRGLVGERAISREEMKHYETAMQTAEAEYHLVQAQLDAASALVENTTLYNHPSVKRAAANLQQAYLNLQRTTIVAPVTGYIAKRSVQLGMEVNLGTSLMAIVPLNNVWVEANYKESQLGRIRIGQSVTLNTDAYDDIEYHGKVIGISAGTGSAFDLLPPQNATGNWIKIVQRLPVRIALDTEELKAHPLRIGLSTRVTINTHNTSGLTLAEVSNDKPIYTTTAFNTQLAEANQLIDQIIHANSPDISLANNTFPAEPIVRADVLALLNDIERTMIQDKTDYCVWD